MPDSVRPFMPAVPTAEVRDRLAAELGLPSRLGYTLLLLAGLAVAAVTGALLLTEPVLPARTQLAFGAIVLAGLAWAAFAAWVLARRRVLFARHRLVAARLAVTVTALFAAGALALSLRADAPAAAPLAAAAGAGMFVVALVVLVRARRRVGELEQRRERLERRLVEEEGGR